MTYLIFLFVVAICATTYGYKETHDIDKHDTYAGAMLVFGALATVVLFVVILWCISWVIPVTLMIVLVGVCKYKKRRRN